MPPPAGKPPAPLAYVIRFDFDKARLWPVGYGYDQRPDVPLAGITLHSTEHQPGQVFTGVCAYLRDSADVSIHYVVGLAGEIQRVLDPGPWRAWHAGPSTWAGRPECNDWCVGIEIYHREGGPDYTPSQLGALRWLCRQLMVDHPTIVKPGVNLHRWCALPAGRKADPTDRNDIWWEAFIAAL